MQFHILHKLIMTDWTPSILQISVWMGVLQG